MACSLNDRDNHLEFLAITAMRLKEKIQSLKEDENIDINQYIRDVYQKYINNGFSEKDAAEYAQFVPNAIKMALSYDEVGFYIDVKNLQSLVKDFDSFDNVLKFVKGESVLTEEEVTEIKKNDLDNSLNPDNSNANMSNDDFMIYEQEDFGQKREDRVEETKIQGAEDKTINRTKSKSKEQKYNERGKKLLDKAIKLLYKSGAEIDSSGFIKLTENTDLDVIKKVVAAIVLFENNASKMTEVDSGKQRIIRQAINELNGEGYTIHGFKIGDKIVFGQNIEITNQTIDPSSPNAPEIAQKKIITFINKAQILKDDKEIQRADVNIEIQNLSKEEIKNKIRLIENKIEKAESLGVTDSQTIKITKKELQELKDYLEKSTQQTGEVEDIYEATPSNIFSTISRRINRNTDEQILEDPNEDFYSDFINEFFIALNQSSNLAVNLTFAGHTGFKIKLVKANDINTLDENDNYIGDPNHVRKSHYDYVTDPNYITYKYDRKTKKTKENNVPLSKRIEAHKNDGVSLVITDTNGNILYFTKDQNNKYQISDSQNGKPLYYNMRKEFGTSKEQNIGNFKNVINATEKANKELPKDATKEERNAFIKAYIKRTKEEIKLINGLISLVTKHDEVIVLDIDKINPGYILQDYKQEENPLKDIDWDNVSFIPTFEFKNNQIIMTTYNGSNDIKIDSPKIKDTKYFDIIKTLLTNDNLKYDDGFTMRNITVLDRINLINNYVFDNKITFKEKNKKLIIEELGKEISAEDFIKKIDNWFLNLNKTNNNNGQFNDVVKIENNVVKIEEKNTNKWIIDNFSSHLVLGKYNTIPMLGGYITFNIPNDIELMINPKKQEILEKVIIDPIAKRLPYEQVINIINTVLLKQKSFIKLSKDGTHYEHIKDGKVHKRYKRVTDIIDAKGDDLKIFSELDRNNAFELKKDPDTGQSYFIINEDYVNLFTRDYLYNEDGSHVQNKYMDTNIKQMLNLKVATEVGTAMDIIFRDFFNDGVKSFEEYSENLNYPPFANQEVFNEYITSLKKLQQYFSTNNLEVITQEIRLYSEALGIAGTIDMLTVNRDTGEIGMIDLKTKKNLRYWAKGFENGISAHNKTSKQLSAYRIMVHNQNNLLVENIRALIGKTDYDGKSGNPTADFTVLGGPFIGEQENPNNVQIIDEFFLEVDMLDVVDNPNSILLQISEPIKQIIADQTDKTKEQIKELNKEKDQIEEALEESEKLIKRVKEQNLNEEERKRKEKEEEEAQEEKRKEDINKEVETIPVDPPEEIQEDIDTANEKMSEETQEKVLDKVIDDTELSKEEAKAVDKESEEGESQSDTIKRLITNFKKGAKKFKNAILKNLIHRILKILHITTIAVSLTFATGAIGLKTGVIQKIASNDTINSFIAENVDEDVANVLTLPMHDIMDVGMNYYYKKTQTGPYSEEAVKNMQLKLEQQAQEEEARIEALYQANQIEEAEYAAEMERVRQEKLIFLEDPISIGQRVYTFKNGAHMKPAVVDLGTSADREGIRFDIAHNVHASKRTYADQPNKTISNSYGIVGAFHNKFVPYDQTSNDKFSVPVQITWNQITKILEAKKTEDLDSTDLVIPFGKGGVGNVTKLDNLEIKKLEDGSFNITTGIDKINGTSVIKSKKGKPFHIGLAPKGKERVLNSKDLKEYRPLRGGLVIIFDNDAEVSVLVTGSPNQIFSVIDELQKKHPEKKWNILKGDTGSYATSAFNTDGKTDNTDYKTYSNQNTYGQSQLLILLKPEKKKDTTPLNASLILFGLLTGLRSKNEFGAEITNQEISDLKASMKEARKRLDEINKEIASLQIETSDEPIKINKTETSQDKTEWTNKMGPNTQQDDPSSYDDLFRLKPGTKTTRTETKRQIKRAEKWYNENMPRFPKGHEKAGELMLPFRAAYKVVNSNAYAQFTTQAVLLFKGSNATDLYHEAWHGFTQLFLTSQERTELYEDVKKDSGTFKTHKGETKKFSEASSKEIEEYLAEDFRHYGMSKGKIAKKGVRKNIFQKIWDFLFGWIGKYNYVSAITRPETLENIRLLQKNLYNGNIEQNKYDVNNAEWGVLAYGIEPVNEDENTRSIEESLLINESVNMLLSDFINEQNERTGDARWTSAYLVKPELLYKFGYRYVLDKFIERRFELIQDFDKETDVDEKARLQNKIDILNFSINNFGELNDLNEKGVIAYNLKHNKQLNKVITNKLKFDVLDDQNELMQWIQTVEGSSNNLSSLDAARNSTINIIKSLHKYNLDGSIEKNILGFPVAADFTIIWNRLQKSLVGSYNGTEMWNRLTDETYTSIKIRNIINELKLKLGNPTNNSSTTLTEENTWGDFWQTFNKSHSPLEQLTINTIFDEESNSSIEVTFGEASSNLSKIAFDITSNFKTLIDPNEYITADKDGIRTLNFKKNSPLRRKYNTRKSAETVPFEFLYDIGIRLEDNQSIKNALNNKDLKNRIGWLYVGLENLFNKNPNIEITDIIGDLMNTQSGNINAILDIQLRYSDAYHSFMRNNAANEPQNIHTYNNEITVITNAINNSEDFNELINKPYMSYLASSPHVKANGILNAIFDFNTINGPKKLDKYGNPVKLELSNLSGLVLLINDNRDEGVSNIDLTKHDKLIFDIHTLLLGGKVEMPRAETSRTSYAVNASDLKLTKYSPYLYVDLYQFYSENNVTIDNTIINNGVYKTISLLTNHLKSEIERIIRINSGNEVEALNWTVGEDALSKKLIAFNGVLSEELVAKIEKSINIKKPNSDTIINRYKTDIIKDINIYLNNLIDETYRAYRYMPFIAPQLRNKYNNEVKNNFVETKSDNRSTKSIVAAYVTNQLLNKFDLISLFFGDLSIFTMENEAFNKRNKGANSTGELFRTDPKLYNFLNSTMRQKYAESIGHSPMQYNGIINSVVTEDVIVISERYDEYRRAWANHYAKIYPNKSNDEINKLSDAQVKPFSELNEADGAAWATFDIYRFLSIQQSKWSPSQEELYNKIINKEPIDNINISEFFPVRKYQYFGPMVVGQGQMAPWVYHKYAIMPLIPGITAVGNLEKLHDKLVKSNNHYMTVESGSKLAIKTANEKLNSLYKNKVEPAKNREFNEDEVYITNSIYVEFLKDQIDSSNEYKGTTTFATQARKVLISGMFSQGSALSNEISELVTKYENLIKERTKRTEKLIKEQTGYDKNNKDLSGLISIIRSSLANGKLAPHEYESINVDEVTNELEIDFSLLLNSNEIEKLLISWANRHIIKQKFNGEMNVQIPNTGFEMELRSELTAEEKIEYGTNGLRIYTREGVGKRGLTLAAQTMISLQGDFKLLLKAEHLDGKVIGTLDRLNEMIQDPKWLDIGDNRKMITITGPRIPTAGPNMIEFFEIFKFLPEKAGNIIILPSGIVAKSGTDFDYDKLTNYYMNIISVNGKPELVKNINVKESKETLEERKDYIIEKIEEEKLKIEDTSFKEAFAKLNENLKKEYSDANRKFLNDSLQLRKRISFLRNKWKKLNNTKNKIGKLVVQQNKIREEIDQIQKTINDISEKYKLHDIQLFILKSEKKKVFDPLYEELGEITRKLAALTTKGIDNEIVDVSIQIMKQPEYFLQLIEPLNSDRLEDLAQEIRESKKGKDRYSPYRDTRSKRKDDGTYVFTNEKKHIKIFEPLYFIEKHTANSAGMEVLGIYATNITMKSLLNKVGMHVSKLNHNYKIRNIDITSLGQGTIRGDGKDYAMRGEADGFIGEMLENEKSNMPDNLWNFRPSSSTGSSFAFIGRKESRNEDFLYYDNNPSVMSGIAGDNFIRIDSEGSHTINEKGVIMLARNGEFKNLPLHNNTKQAILKSHKSGSTFIVGDMPGVDSHFVEYLQEIGADFEVFTNGYNRLELFEIEIPLPHNERSGKQLDLFDDQKDVGKVISLSDINDVNNEISIAYTNSAFLNGSVDIGKSDWLFDINAGIENAPLISMFNNAGVPYEYTVFYMSNPIIKYYNNQTNIQNSLFFKVIPKNNIDIKSPFDEILTVLNLKDEYQSFNTTSGKMKYLHDFVNTNKKDFTLDNLRRLATEGIYTEEDKRISTALFFSYYFLQEYRGLSDQYKQLIQTLNYDTSKPVSLYDIFYKNSISEDLLRLNAFPPRKLLRLRDESIISSFNTGPFQIEMWSNLFKITNHNKINNLIGDLIFQQRGRVMESYGSMSKEKFVTTFKQDLINFIFQNVLHKNNNISDGLKHGYKIIEKEVPTDILENIFNASQDEKIFSLAADDKIYLDRRRLITEWKNNKNLYPGLKSFEDFKNFEIEKAYLRNIITSDDLLNDINFKNIYDNLIKNTSNPNEKTIIRTSYEIYIKNKALENLNNRHNNFVSNNSYANRYMEIKNRYENELEEYIFIRNVHIDQGNRIKNLKLLERVKDEERIIAYHNSLTKLMDPNVKKVSNESENNMISEFFQKFPLYAYLQTGPNTSSPLSFMKIIDQKTILNILRSVQDEVINNLNDSKTLIYDLTIDDFLDAFNYQRSTSNKSNAFRSLDYIGKQDKFVDANIAIKMDTENPQYILMSDKVGGSIEKYKNDTNVTFILSGNQNKNKAFYSKYYKNISKEIDSGKIKVLSIYTGQTTNLTLSDNNLESNKKLLLEDIQEIKNIRDNGNTLIFLSEGYSGLENSAPQTNLWLLNQLKDNFQYIDLNLNAQNLTIKTSNKLLRDNINEVLDETLQELKKC